MIQCRQASKVVHALMQRTEEEVLISFMKRWRKVARHNAHAVYFDGLERTTDRGRCARGWRAGRGAREMGGAPHWRPTRARAWLTPVAPPPYNHRTVARHLFYSNISENRHTGELGNYCYVKKSPRCDFVAKSKNLSSSHEAKLKVQTETQAQL